MAKQSTNWKTRPKYNTNNWHSRGYLPHYNETDTTQFVTFRLADSLPKDVIENIKLTNNSQLNNSSIENFNRINEYLDKGYGECHLKNPLVADCVIAVLEKYENLHYNLHAWVVMPNHVHLLFTLINGSMLNQVVRLIKGNSAYQANKIVNLSGNFWFKDYYDQYIRDELHFNTVEDYICSNPVKAGLCMGCSDWKYSSYRKD